jgi:phosphoglycolate phosphatase
MRHPPACILFDLDGTLLDTAPDMAGALNRLRHDEGHPALPIEHIRPHVSHGALALIKFGFDITSEHPRFEGLRQRYLDIYRNAIAVHTTLFPGMGALLAMLESNAIPWGVVTNKPGWLTEPLLAELGLLERAACVVSGDTTPSRKPDPGPLLHACRTLSVDPGRCLYVGDAERDIEAGKRAGMATVIARFGYLGVDDDPELWGADEIIDHPEELHRWLAGCGA